MLWSMVPKSQGRYHTGLANMRLNIRCSHSLCNSKFNVKLYQSNNTVVHVLKQSALSVHNDFSRSSKVVELGTNRKSVWDFLLVLNIN